MLDILVVWLKLGLDSGHFCTHLQLLLRMNLCLQVLTHVPRVFTLKDFVVHVGSLSFQSDDVRIISLFSYPFQNGAELQLIKLDLTGIFGVTS